MDKPLTDFYSHRSTRDRLKSECKKCWNMLTLAHHIKNRDKRLPQLRDNHYRKTYGITFEDFQKLKIEQNNCCYLCEKSFDEIKAHMDHCHYEGTLRKVLCSNCNHGIGSFQDNPELMRKAANYIEEFNRSVTH